MDNLYTYSETAYRTQSRSAFEALFEFLVEDLSTRHTRRDFCYDIAYDYSHFILHYLPKNEKDARKQLQKCIKVKLEKTARGVYEYEERGVHERSSYLLFDKIHYEEILESVFPDFSLVQRALLLHIILYPHDIFILEQIGFSIYEKWHIVSTLIAMYGDLMKNYKDGFPDFFPETFTEKAALLAKLEQRYPELLVILLLFRDPKLLLQFLLLFGGSTLRVPTLAQLRMRIGQESSDLTSASKYATLINSDGDCVLVDSIAEFLQESYKILIHNYEDFLRKLIEEAEVGSTKSLLTVYNFFQREITHQIKLVKDGIDN